MVNLKKRHITFLNLNPVHKKEFLESFSQVLDSGNFILGSEVKNFEKNFARYLNIKHCIGVGNGLEALQISLMALGIGKGDEVITTPLSAVATTLAILAVGAKPVFVDTDANGLINTDLIRRAITQKTRAILPVHLYGNPVNLEKIQTICQKNNLYLIEDAAQAHGSTYQGKKLGTFGDLGCFSFYPTKNLGALGDGGAIVTDNKKLASICREIRDYGQQKKYLHLRYGLNSRLDEMQAAFLNIKLKYLETENTKRRTLAKTYTDYLSDISDIEIVRPQNIADSNFHLFVIKLNARDRLRKYLKENGIQALIHYPITIPSQSFLKKAYSKPLSVAEDFTKTCLSLPINPQMSLDDVKYISETIKRFFKPSKKRLSNSKSHRNL